MIKTLLMTLALTLYMGPAIADTIHREDARFLITWDPPKGEVDRHGALTGYKLLYSVPDIVRGSVPVPADQTSKEFSIRLASRNEPYPLTVDIIASYEKGDSLPARAFLDVLVTEIKPPNAPVILNIELICSQDPCPIQINLIEK